MNLLPLLLDVDGIDVVAAVNSVGILRPIVSNTRPDVVILDQEIGADAIEAARVAYAPVAIVVVWPAAVIGVGADVHVLPGIGAKDLAEAVLRASRSVRDEEVIVVVPEAAEPVTAATPVIAAARRPHRMGKLATAASLALLMISAGLAGVMGSRSNVTPLAAPPSISVPRSPGESEPVTEGSRPVGNVPVILKVTRASAAVQQPATGTGSGGGSVGEDSPGIRSHETPRILRTPEHEVSHDRGRRDRTHRHPRPAPHGGGDHEPSKSHSGHGHVSSHGHEKERGH